MGVGKPIGEGARASEREGRQLSRDRNLSLLRRLFGFQAARRVLDFGERVRFRCRNQIWCIEGQDWAP